MSVKNNDNESVANLNAELILVVDDDPSQSLILKNTLENKGYRIIEANNGKEAISLFQQYQPDMVLLDAVMPEMDGFETCRNIRSGDGGDQTLILMLTSLNDDRSVEQAFESGAVDFITKPIYWSVLFGRVKYLLQAKNSDLKIRQVEEQLRHSQKMEAIGHLTNGISHNFNNILTSILGYTDLLLDVYMKDEKGKPIEYLQQINMSAKRAHSIVSQMQAFTNKGKGDSEILNPVELLDESIRMLRPALPDSIELHLDMQKQTPCIKIDPVQFQQMLMNLLMNAGDSMDNKGRIDVALHEARFNESHCASCHHEVSGEFIELTISDTGKGIDNVELAKIFDPYYSGKSFGESTGMGLSVVHGIVHDSDGHILVDSNLAKGSVFRILFPIIKNIKLPDSENMETTSDENLESVMASHILVVDDEEVVATYESELLQLHGYKATIMTDPRDAIEAITNNPDKFDLVLSDKTMPGLDGLELAGAIMAVRADLPVILCTGYSGSLPDIDLECIGIHAQLDKPVKGTTLLRTIKTVLEK